MLREEEHLNAWNTLRSVERRGEEVPFVRVSTLWVVGRCEEGTPFFGAKGRIIDRPSAVRLVVPSLVITYLPQSSGVRR